ALRHGEDLAHGLEGGLGLLGLRRFCWHSRSPRAFGRRCIAGAAPNDAPKRILTAARSGPSRPPHGGPRRRAREQANGRIQLVKTTAGLHVVMPSELVPRARRPINVPSWARR